MAITRVDLRHDWVEHTAQSKPLRPEKPTRQMRECFSRLVDLTFAHLPEAERERMKHTSFDGYGRGAALDPLELIHMTPPESTQDAVTPPEFRALDVPPKPDLA